MATPSFQAECARIRAALQAGKLDEARGLCQRVLAAAPAAPEPLYLMGTLLLGTGKLQEAGQYFLKALAAQPIYPDAYFQLGNLLFNVGKNEEAISAYQQALNQNPRHTEAAARLAATLVSVGKAQESLPFFQQAMQAGSKDAGLFNNLGVALRALNRLPEALTAFSQAVSINPRHAEARCSVGHVLKLQGKFAEALPHYIQASTLKPALHESLLGAADCLRETGKYDEALVTYRRFLGLHARHAEGWNHLGLCYEALGRHDEALQAFSQAVNVRHDFPEALNHLAATLLALGRPAEARQSAARARELAPESADIANNLAIILLRLGKLEEALAAAKDAVRLRPSFSDAHLNLGTIQHALGNPTAAIADFLTVLTLNPQHHAARFNLAASLLLTGSAKEGWSEFEHRPTASLRSFASPRLTSVEDLHGKTVLVHAEQGLGDTLQFIRYLPALRALGATVIAEVQPALASLLAGIEGADLLLARGAPLPAFDFHAPLLSLPHLLGGAAFNKAPAPARLDVSTDELQLWRERLSVAPAPRLGLVWSGNAAHQNDHNRSLPLARLAPLLETTPASFFCLQKEFRPEDHALIEKLPNLTLLANRIEDFTDTAAIIRALDVVITVDTSVAHLAASLGAETWLLLPFVPDWRWLLEGDTTPWYPSMRLFRQTSPGDWQSVVERLRTALQTRFPLP